MFDYKLALATGVDIPIPELQTVLHQPTIKEISMIGETNFFTGIQLLCIQKTMYIEDEFLLANTTNFQIFMTMMNEKQIADKKQNVIQALSLLFPNAAIVFTPRSLIINFGEVTSIVDEGNFDILQQLLQKVFCLNSSDQQTFNPGSKKAKEIADKLMKARQKVAAAKAKDQGDGSAFGQYLSILTIGVSSMTLQDCINLTIYQLYDLIERYGLYVNWDLDIRSRLAGAKGDKPVENWMKPIHK